MKHRGVMDKALDDSAEGPGFESRAGFVTSIRLKSCRDISAYLR